MRLNGDAGANYDYQQLQGQAAGVFASETFGGTAIFAGVMPAVAATANCFNAGFSFIPNYANSANNKAGFTVSFNKFGTSTNQMQVNLTGGFWRSNAAINRITLIPNSGNFVAGTRVTLYGMGS